MTSFTVSGPRLSATVTSSSNFKTLFSKAAATRFGSGWAWLCVHKDGKLDGLQTTWYENGQKHYQITTKDGQSNGLTTEWYENGLKFKEEPYKDGKEDGLWIRWWDNGQKYTEKTYRDGKYISEKYWN